VHSVCKSCRTFSVLLALEKSGAKRADSFIYGNVVFAILKDEYNPAGLASKTVLRPKTESHDK
jgi:hypothetical protein